MRGGAIGKMAILKDMDIINIKAIQSLPSSITNDIKAGMGIEIENIGFIIHTAPGSMTYINDKLYPNISEQVLQIYNNAAARSGLVPILSIDEAIALQRQQGQQVVPTHDIPTDGIDYK